MTKRTFHLHEKERNALNELAQREMQTEQQAVENDR